MKDNKEVFNKIQVISFVLSMLVIAMHTSTTYFYGLDNTRGINRVVYDVIEFVRNQIGTIAVPMFFFMSGVLFYRNYTIQGTMEKYRTRVKSLVIPYVVWNFLAWAFSLALSSIPFVKKYIAMRQLAELSWKDFFQAIVFYKYNSFYWFMAYLIVYVLLCIPIYIVLKNKIVGAIVVLLCIYTGWIHPAYILGAYVGIHFYDLFIKQYKKNMRIVGGVIAIGMLFLFLYKDVLDARILNCLIVISLLSIWVTLDGLRKIDVSNHAWINNSFLIYSSQIIVASSICKLLLIVLPKNAIGEIFNFTGTIAISVIVCCVFNKYCKKYFPFVHHVLNGWRA